MTRIARLSVLLALAASPAAAQQDVARVDLLPGWRDGARHVAGLRIDLAPGWKTYWRAPGEAGIPPRFDWSGSENVESLRIHWPVPDVYEQNGLTSVVYGDGVVLPVLVTPRDPDRPVALRLGLDIGVCNDVCVPYGAALSVELPVGGAAPDPLIRAALADRPLTEDEARAGPVTCTVSQTEEGLRIAAEMALPSLGGDEFAILELPDERVWIAEARTRRNGPRLTASAEAVAPGGQAVTFERDDLRLTILGARGAADIRGCD